MGGLKDDHSDSTQGTHNKGRAARAHAAKAATLKTKSDLKQARAEGALDLRPQGEGSDESLSSAPTTAASIWSQGSGTRKREAWTNSATKVDSHAARGPESTRKKKKSKSRQAIGKEGAQEISA